MADDGIHGHELWKSDGTEAGTVMVKDINPTGSSYPWLWTLTNMNGTSYFLADDGIHGRELWMSNGTVNGTKMVKDIRPGTEGSYLVPGFYIISNGKLFFAANDGTHGNDLWISDGTEAGTELVKDINPLSGSIDCFYGCIHSIINGLLFFEAFNQSNGFELWVSDGTEAGTEMVKDINPGTGSSRNCFWNCSWTIADGILYFAASDGTNGRELWMSDGSETGTAMINNINPFATDDNSRSGPRTLKFINDVLFFVAEDGIHGEELWQSDGTESGTEMVQDIYVGSPGSIPRSLTVSGSKLFFVADDGVHGYELWALPIGLMNDLSINGDSEGEIGVEYNFTAEVSPLDSTTPVTYEWQATDQEDVTNNSGLSDTVKFVWDTAGTKTISVTARNGVNELHKVIQIEISEVYLEIFVPIVLGR